jgi:hypothetical protein
VLGGEEPEAFDGFENVEVSRGEGKRCVRLQEMRAPPRACSARGTPTIVTLSATAAATIQDLKPQQADYGNRRTSFFDTRIRMLHN